MYESTGAGGRSEAAPAGEAGPPMEEGPPQEFGPKGEPLLLQASGATADVEEYQDVVFLQVSSVQNEDLSAPVLRKKAIAVLSKAAKNQKSLALSSLVSQL